MAPPSKGLRGSVIARGPMASDHYTQIHNLAVRGAIHTKYVGIFGYISSHQEGWTLTTAYVAAKLEVGPDFVTAALKAIEKANCLIRGRLRDSAGKVRGSVWFVTDLALQLRQLGVEDEGVIKAQVQAAYEQWITDNADALFAALNGAGDDTDPGTDEPRPVIEPNRENPVLVVTRENADPRPRFRRSAPKRDSPDQAEPDQADPVHKKNNPKKTNTSEKTKEEPGGTLPPDPLRPQAPTASGPGTDSRDERSNPHQLSPQAVDRDSRPRARENAEQAGSDVDGSEQTTVTGESTPAGEPAETAADASAPEDTHRGALEAQGSSQAAQRADLEDAPPADGRAAARAVAARAARGRRHVVPRQSVRRGAPAPTRTPSP